MAKIAILGGGAAGLAAAFELTDPALATRHEVTVYEMSWRLGGKCASGRNPQMDSRIEEHGLHIWFGFYNNAFEILDRALREHEGGCWRCIEDAFTPHDSVGLCSAGRDGASAVRDWSFPPADGRPGEYEELTFADVLRRALAFVRIPLGDSDDDLPEPREHGPVARVSTSGLRHALDEAIELVEDALEDAALFSLKELMRVVRKLADVAPDGVAGVVDYALVLDVFATIVIGLIDDELTGADADWSALNDEELSAWLERHGSKIGDAAAIAATPMVRCFYELCFAYAGGDRERPDLAAGKALQALLRLAFGYRGRVMWKMRSGMGDTVFTPLYDVLSARGVRFAFFHRVTDLEVGDGTLSAVHVTRTHTPSAQAQDPLVTVGELRCWPSAPKDPLDFDPEHELPAGCDDRLVLRRGTDFDTAVLAIPVGALGEITTQVAAASPAFAAMLGAVPTAATQALQLWYAQAPPHAGDGCEVTGAFPPPLDTCSGMDQVSATEGFPSGAVAHVAYLCGVMRDVPGEDRAAATARARADGLALLHGDARWLGTAGPDAGPRWEMLYDPQDRSGESRYEAQYWRANIDGAHRYTLTPAGSIQARLRPHESGVAHLVLAGDWTRNGICGGSVEAAVTSGRLAARAIDPGVPEVNGVGGWLERD